MPQPGENARGKAARELVGRYHERELRRLLEYVRDGYARERGGELDWWATGEPHRRQ
jgi:hypothetical protein